MIGVCCPGIDFAERRRAALAVGASDANQRTMNFQIDVSSAVASPSVEPPASSGIPETVDLLRQILEVQREQLAYQRAAAAAHDMTARWRAFLTRWQQDFPDLGESCRKALPHLERCYGQLLHDLTDKLTDDEHGLENEFALQEFLDRFGMRLAQLGTILNLVAPLAEASNATQGEAT
jgi:hypothetical protein